MSLMHHNNKTIQSKITENVCLCVVAKALLPYGNQNLTNTRSALYFVRGLLYVYQV